MVDGIRMIPLLSFVKLEKLDWLTLVGPTFWVFGGRCLVWFGLVDSADMVFGWKTYFPSAVSVTVKGVHGAPIMHLPHQRGMLQSRIHSSMGSRGSHPM